MEDRSFEMKPTGAQAYHGEINDTGDMEQFGYKPELERKFGLWSMVGFSCTIMITWEGMLFVFTYGLEDGGPAGLFYGFLF